MAIWNWSKVATNNATADTTINWSEGMPPSAVNDSARAMMARIAEWRDDSSGSLTTAGTSTAYTLTTNEGLNTPTPTTGQLIAFMPHVGNGASPTLAVDGGSSYAIQQSPGVAVAASFLVLGSPYTAMFNGTAWILRDVPGVFGAATFGGAAVFNSTATFNGATALNATTTLAAAINETRVTVASATTTNIGAAAANYILISGTTTITAFDTIQAGTERTLEFQGALTLTYNATSLILPGSISITTAAGDTAIFRSEGSGNWRCISYFRASNPPIGLAPTVQRFLSGSGTCTPSSAGVKRWRVEICAGGGGGGATATNNGANGTDSSFGSWTAIHGNGGVTGAGNNGGTGGAGGVDGTGTLVDRVTGGDGGGRLAFGTNGAGPSGGENPRGGAGVGQGNAAGLVGKANTGAGGGAGGGNAGNTGTGGGAGEYVEFWVNAPTATSYVVGAGGNGGAAGTNAGGNGAAGIIIVEEFYW